MRIKILPNGLFVINRGTKATYNNVAYALTRILTELKEDIKSGNVVLAYIEADPQSTTIVKEMRDEELKGIILRPLSDDWLKSGNPHNDLTEVDLFHTGVTKSKKLIMLLSSEMIARYTGTIKDELSDLGVKYDDGFFPLQPGEVGVLVTEFRKRTF